MKSKMKMKNKIQIGIKNKNKNRFELKNEKGQGIKKYFAISISNKKINLNRE